MINEKVETQKEEKNGAHMHVCTTVQLDDVNIHGGCCLFSHNLDKQKQILPKCD